MKQFTKHGRYKHQKPQEVAGSLWTKKIEELPLISPTTKPLAESGKKESAAIASCMVMIGFPVEV